MAIVAQGEEVVAAVGEGEEAIARDEMEGGATEVGEVLTWALLPSLESVLEGVQPLFYAEQPRQEDSLEELMCVSSALMHPPVLLPCSPTLSPPSSFPAPLLSTILLLSSQPSPCPRPAINVRMHLPPIIPVYRNT